MSAILTSTDKLLRTTNIIAGSSDFTYHFWFRLNTDSGVGFYQSLFTLEDSSPAFEKYIQIFTEDTGSGPEIGVSASNNVSTFFIPGPAITIGQWYECALVKIGSQFRLYVNGVFIDSATLSFAAVTFDSMYIGYDTFATNDFNVASYREWNNDLTAAQVLAECKSSVPVLVTGLQTNTPLVDNPDDTTGNNNDWTETGITYEADSPYPAVNVDPTNAIDLGTLAVPYQQIVDANPSGGFAFDLWWKITVPAGVIGVRAYGRSGSYLVNRCDVDIWDTPGATTGASTSSEDNYPIVSIVLNEGDLHYISAVPSSRTASPYVVTMDIARLPVTPFQATDIFSNDDQPNRPAVFLSSVTDYLVREYRDLPSGESGDILLNGNFLLGDRYAPNMKLYNISLTLLAEFTGAHGGNHSRGIRSNRATSKIYFVRNGTSSPAIIDRVSGVAIDETFTLSDMNGGVVGAIMPNLTDTVLYYAQHTSNGPIKGWDIPGNAPLGNIVSGVSGELVVDMLALADGTFAVLRMAAFTTAKLYHYASDWSLTNTWDLGQASVAGVPPRMSWALDDPNSVWVKLFRDDMGDPIITEFRNVKMSDGSELGDVLHATFFDGAYTPELFDGSAAVATMGCPSSCPFFLMPLGDTPEPPEPDKSGIFFVNPDKPEFRDSYYGSVNAKIPNPTVRTALFGE